MPLITADEIDRAVPPARYEDVAKYAPYLEEGLEKFAIDTPARIAAFIAQVAHESGDFLRVEENLNYSWQALRATWPARFASDALAQGYHRQPEKIADHVYAGRYGNGDEASGDGWKFRGRGLIQVTFRDNYAAYAQAIGDASVLADPSQLAQPRHAALSACWFWSSNRLNTLADLGTEVAFNDISYKINGGWNGKADRLENWAQAKAVLEA
ncbi:MAG TPA: glycoside hydrolase family 19 protein [Burkholderiales bacterium]|jgi:putative chitinase